MAQQRKTKTEERLREALTQQLRERGVEGISVSSLTRAAGINRGTFYAHYTDKFDFVEAQMSSFIGDLADILLAHDEKGDAEVDPLELIPYARVLEAMRYVKENQALVAAFTNDGTDLRLQPRIKSVLTELIEREVAQAKGLTLSFKGLPTEYGREILLSNVVSIIWLWISRDCAESPEEIARIIDVVKETSPLELLE